jgi:diguanylate cyclase (GGDEF)-like protein
VSDSERSDRPDSARLPGTPTRVRTEEVSVPNPAAPPGPILTLSPEEISRFFVRARRDQDTERWDVRLDAALREILERANEFVPSESGGILLDDPRAKLAGAPAPRLTFIATFGPGREQILGGRIPSDRGFAGQIYATGHPLQTDHVELDDPIRAVAPMGTTIRTLVGVPVIVGESICGVLQLSNRRSGGSYTPRDRELLRIFAAYMSSSIQNALDAIRARAQARVDDLTGLFNSRYFHTRLEDEISRADRDGTDLCMLFIDLDHFKEVNDRFGHLAGSWTLQKVAQILSENAPAASVLARYGGDEFVIILPGANLTRAVQTGESMTRVIAAATFFEANTDDTPKPAPSVSASIGVASYRDHLAPGGTQRRRENIFLRLADSAMYRAKANGRNRVETAEPED